MVFVIRRGLFRVPGSTELTILNSTPRLWTPGPRAYPSKLEGEIETFLEKQKIGEVFIN